MPLNQIDLPQATIENEKIDGFLTGMCNVQEARKLSQSDDIKFYDAVTRTYLSGREHVNDSSIGQVKINLGEGKSRYFKRIDYVDGSLGAGLKATAWRELDENGNFIEKDGGAEIRLNFAGFALKEGIINSFKNKDIPTLYNTLRNHDQLSEQAIQTVEFVNEIISRYKKNSQIGISHIIYGAHSMGAANALVAHVISDIEGVPTQSTLAIEEVKGRVQAEKIKSALQNKDSKLHREIVQIMRGKGLPDREIESLIAAEPKKLEDAIEHNTISIHAFTIGKNGSEKPSISTRINSGNQFGEEVLQDVSEALKSERPSKHSEEPKPKPAFINFAPEHRLGALLKTARSGNYYQQEATKKAAGSSFADKVAKTSSSETAHIV